MLSSCTEEISIPLPRAYPRVDLPEPTYVAFDKADCPFVFDRPTYTSYVKDSMFFDKQTPHPCWFDIYYPDFNGRIHLSYTEIQSLEELTKLASDSYDLAFKHTNRAEYIDDFQINRQGDVYGAIFDLEGFVASPYQFYLTDSSKHFLRGSLYFNSRPEPDSMKPVVEFVKSDIAHMISSLQWR